MDVPASHQHELLIGHLNIYHLCSKIPDLSVLLQQPTPFHLFGVTETRLHSAIPDDLVSIPNFTIHRRDSAIHKHTGMAVYIHNSIQNVTRRRTDLESSAVESVWVEVKATKSACVV